MRALRRRVSTLLRKKANICFRPEAISESEIGDIVRQSGFGIAKNASEIHSQEAKNTNASESLS